MLTTTDKTRDWVGGWLAGVPVIQPPARPEFTFTDEQQHARAKQEAALRNAHRRALHEARMRVCSL
jgi:hypothetical protein